MDSDLDGLLCSVLWLGRFWFALLSVCLCCDTDACDVDYPGLELERVDVCSRTMLRCVDNVASGYIFQEHWPLLSTDRIRLPTTEYARGMKKQPGAS